MLIWIISKLQDVQALSKMQSNIALCTIEYIHYDHLKKMAHNVIPQWLHSCSLIYENRIEEKLKR